MMKNDSGLLSLDFIVGFTVFLAAFIVVIGMLPGVYVNIQSSSADSGRDMTAYRTGVILAEDSGISSDGIPWEQQPPMRPENIVRLGLAVSKETPNILSPEKIERFYNVPAYFNLTADEYRAKLLFGERPRNFNISFKEDGKETLYIGDRVPDAGYGFSKCYVKVKDAGRLVVPAGDLTRDGVTIELPEGADEYIYRNTTSFILSHANLSDRSVPPAYRIDPKTERAVIVIGGINTVLGVQDGISSAVIESVGLFADGDEVAMPQNGGNEPYNMSNKPYICTVDGMPVETGSEIHVKDAGVLEFVLYPNAIYFPNSDSKLEIRFNMRYTCLTDGEYRFIQGETDYDYDSPYLIPLHLTDGVLEVCIW
ncbi:hypothetical protein [Methanomicrobium mobile]|uniref:hypothetical protein n=1 Tax=Methanomicrobium mobile TaxID=2205 RepID=UPI0005B2A611|nr:hypothetical protein [Methanomicrobium mobile]